jgi:formylglycine-generating enzyme required for sulfatase activity
MSRSADLPQRRKPRLPSRRALAAACVLVGALAVSLGIWVTLTQWAPARPSLGSIAPLSPERERALKPLASFRECTKDCPEMIVVPAGEFMMGSTASEPRRFDSEGPQHQVAIAKRFAVSRFDVTFDDWDACVTGGSCPELGDAGFGRGTRPVINVTWDDAQRYAAWLANMTGQPYRLLTEAEWEYAARAGTATAYTWGDEIGEGNANCKECGSAWDNGETSPVGSFKPNAFGLYDMAGNVWQWVEDCDHRDYDGAPTDGSAWTGGACSRHAVRGGSWVDAPQLLRSAVRLRFSTTFRISNLGFRIARTLAP